MVQFSFNKRDRSSGAPISLAGRIFGSFFFLIFAAAGCFFFFFMLKSVVIPEVQARSWTETPCVMAGTDETPFVFRYRVQGHFYTSSRYTAGAESLPSGSDGSVFLSQRPRGSEQLCLVNPSDPTEAVFQKGSLSIVFFLIIPIIFMVIGFGGCYGTIRGKKGEKRKDGTRAPKSISAKAAGGMKGKTPGLIFGFVFFAAGAGFMWLIFLNPLLKSIAAKNWAEVSAEVVSSRVESHSGDDGTTYSVDILYAYTYEGRAYRSNQYNFIGGSSSGHSGKAQIVAAYPAGTTFLCWVDPASPQESVISPRLGASAWLGLFPLVFIVVGVGIMVAAMTGKMTGGSRSKRGARRSAGGRVRDPKALRRQNKVKIRKLSDGGIELKAGSSRWGKVVGIFFVACFWNGIVSVFIMQVVKGFQSGSPEWFLVVFLIPFVVIGVGLIVAIPWSLLALANPVPKLIVDRNEVPLGGVLSVRWELAGKVDRIESFAICLVGTEAATYQRGTDTVTDHNEFLSIPILDTTDAGRMASGRTEMEIPVNSMHTFDAGNNEVSWSLKVSGSIPRWPDISASYSIEILPVEVV